MTNNTTTELIDTDGENQAVRCFLGMYQCGGNPSVKSMKIHLEHSGFNDCWPEWVNQSDAGTSGHLSKSGAQDWIRHLFSLEQAGRSAAHGEPSNQAKFEKWATDNGFPTRRRNDPASPDTYFSYETEQRWIVWQACSRTAPGLNDSLEQDTAKRLRRVVNLLGLGKAVPASDADLLACSFSVLGMIAREIEARAKPRPTDDETLRDAVINAVTGLYWCGRVWSAWSAGTMTAGDFFPAEDDAQLVDNIVRIIQEAQGMQQNQPPSPMDTPTFLDTDASMRPTNIIVIDADADMKRCSIYFDAMDQLPSPATLNHMEGPT